MGGTLKFAQGTLDEDEINISDNYFSEESDAGMSVKHFDKSRETFLQDSEDTNGDDEKPTQVIKNGHVNQEEKEGAETTEADPLGVN